jgi:CheY-like chemotaxis protein
MTESLGSEDTISYKPIDILLVEDDEMDIEVTLRAFEKGRIRNNLFVVRDGQEALDFVSGQGQYQNKEKYPRPDLILLDIRMPKLNGFEVLKSLKADPRLDFIPVVMLTSSKNEEDVVKSYGAGAASYIPKPVSYQDFLKVVDGFNFYWQIINKLPNGDDKSSERALTLSSWI